MLSGRPDSCIVDESGVALAVLASSASENAATAKLKVRMIRLLVFLPIAGGDFLNAGTKIARNNELLSLACYH
jgi:hypothetical protein